MKKTAIVILNWNGIGYLKMFLGTVVKIFKKLLIQKFMLQIMDQLMDQPNGLLKISVR